jgi:hypothetical protein
LALALKTSLTEKKDLEQGIQWSGFDIRQNKRTLESDHWRLALANRPAPMLETAHLGDLQTLPVTLGV